jgi:hypothetical protein
MALGIGLPGRPILMTIGGQFNFEKTFVFFPPWWSPTYVIYAMTNGSKHKYRRGRVDRVGAPAESC